tara:strand:- start:76 stop:399 length:324 start_codon:yes stop_codon:yes gene_type:complete
MKKFAYFQDAADAAGKAALLPLNNYLGCEPTVAGLASFRLFFNKVDNAADRSQVVINANNGRTVEAIESVHAALGANNKNGVVVIGDNIDTTFTNLEHVASCGAFTA